MAKKIAILSMSTEPRLMLAGERNGQISIIKCEELAPSIVKLKQELPSELTKLRDRGFIILVDEVVPNFAQYGRAVSMDDKTANGLPIVVAAMQAYTNLKSLRAITFPVDSGGKYEISPSLVEQIRGTDGKITYNIAWNDLKPDTYALLFAIYAATEDSIFDTTTLKDVFNLLDQRQQVDTYSDLKPFNAVINARSLYLEQQ